MTIGHIAFSVKDMGASLAFYSKALGIEKAFSLAGRDGRPWIEYLKVADGQFIELFYEGSPPKGIHLCLTVDDIGAYAARVKESGYTLDAEPSEGSDGNRQAWLTDPDGVRIELMQISPDSPHARARGVRHYED